MVASREAFRKASCDAVSSWSPACCGAAVLDEKNDDLVIATTSNQLGARALHDVEFAPTRSSTRRRHRRVSRGGRGCSKRPATQVQSERARNAASQRLQAALDARRHSRECLVRHSQRPGPKRQQLEMFPSSSAPLCRRLTNPRTDEPFLFQALERRVDGADGERPMGATFDLATNGGTVGVRSETHQGNQHELLELAQRWNHEPIMFHIVDDMSTETCAGFSSGCRCRVPGTDTGKLNGFAAPGSR